MALRARLRAFSESTKNNEVYYLVLWEEEGTVSVHPSKELTTVSGENCQIKFGRTYYTGKIACSGKKEEMLLREKEYINGEYLPFESSDGEKDRKVIAEVNMSNEVPTNKPSRAKRQRKLLSKKQLKAINEQERKDGEKELNIPNETLTDFNETTAHECKISEAKVKSRPTKQSTPIQIQKEVAIGNQDLDGERELDINFNAGEMLTDANKMIGHESEISTTKVKSRSRKRTTPILKEGAKGSQKKEKKIVKVKQKSKGKILGHGSGADEVDSESETESTYCDILALSTAHDDVTAKDIGSGLVNNATESVEQVDLLLNQKLSEDEKEMFEALMKRIESIEKRNCELERRNRHFEYLQQANLSVYPYSGYPLSGLRAPPVNPPYFPVTPPYLTSPLAPHFVTRPPPEISSCQSHMAPDLMTTTQREVDYSQQSCSESTTDLHYRDNDSLDNSVLSDHEASVDCYYEESEPQFYTKATDSCNIKEDKRPNNFEAVTIIALQKKAALQNVEKKPLPPIDHDALITPAKVLHKYPQLISPAKISTFAVRLCKEAYFGKYVMSFRTFSGSGSLPGLPEAQFMAMKAFLFKVCVPALGSKIEFEGFYKNVPNLWGKPAKICVRSISVG